MHYIILIVNKLIDDVTEIKFWEIFVFIMGQSKHVGLNNDIKADLETLELRI